MHSPCTAAFPSASLTLPLTHPAVPEHPCPALPRLVCQPACVFPLQPYLYHHYLIQTHTTRTTWPLSAGLLWPEIIVQPSTLSLQVPRLWHLTHASLCHQPFNTIPISSVSLSDTSSLLCPPAIKSITLFLSPPICWLGDIFYCLAKKQSRVKSVLSTLPSERDRAERSEKLPQKKNIEIVLCALYSCAGPVPSFQGCIPPPLEPYSVPAPRNRALPHPLIPPF